MKCDELIVAGLAVFRLTILISKDQGPGFIFRKLREAPPKKSSLKQGISCPFCVSVWVAFPVVLGLYLIPPADRFYFDCFLSGWALSGIAVILNQAFTKD